jgi:serine phosphatase RsbU (regulator of sigma subunit)
MEFKADPMPIGYYEDIDKLFTKHDIHLVPGDIIYLFTDGYADQFGGPDHKKFKYPAFKSLLARISGQPLSIQKKRLEMEFIEWKGNNPQTDDVLIIGMRFI